MRLSKQKSRHGMPRRAASGVLIRARPINPQAVIGPVNPPRTSRRNGLRPDPEAEVAGAIAGLVVAAAVGSALLPAGAVAGANSQRKRMSGTGIAAAGAGAVGATGGGAIGAGVKSGGWSPPVPLGSCGMATGGGY